MNILNTIIVILAVLIILAVTIQAKGTGLSIIPNSSDFGKFERRGPEEILHQGTIGLIAIFIILAIFSYFIA